MFRSIALGALIVAVQTTAAWAGITDDPPAAVPSPGSFALIAVSMAGAAVGWWWRNRK